MCQTYANFLCASVVNYRYEARNGSKESLRAYVTASLPNLPLTVHCTVNLEIIDDMFVFLLGPNDAVKLPCGRLSIVIGDNET